MEKRTTRTLPAAFGRGCPPTIHGNLNFVPTSLRIAMFAAAIFAVPCGAHADMIGVQFAGGTAIPNGTSAGFAPQTGWNIETTSSGSASLTDTDASTPTSLTWTSGGGIYSAYTGAQTGGNPGDYDLFDGYLDTGSTVTISSLPTAIAGAGSTPYDVFIYIAGQVAGRGGSYQLENGAATYNSTAILTSSGQTTTGSFILATSGVSGSGGGTPGNYYEFANVTGTSFTLTATAQYDSTPGGANPRAVLNGFQIVSVPEPSTLVLAVFGFLALAGRARRYARSRRRGSNP